MLPSLEEISSLVRTSNEEDKKLIEKAYNFAKEAHHGQKRKSGEPYFVHPAFTAKILAELNMSPTVISAGLLHDCLEDAKIEEETIKKEFGQDILNLIVGVTKLGHIKYKGETRNIENLRKFFIYEAEDVRILIIKLAERLHNMETLQFVDKNKQRRLALETLEIYAPLANRLSLSKLKSELEDSAFKYVYPQEYNAVKKMLREKEEVKERYLLEAKEKIKEMIEEAGIKNVEISYRQKHLYSLWRKLERYNIGIDKIYDIIAIRIIVPTVEDCYTILGLLHGQWKPKLDRIRDYITSPKNNGYQSIHTIVSTETGGLIEVQIRTYEMHEQAENGLAAHFTYKEKYKKEDVSLKQKEWSRKLNSLFKNKSNSEEPLKIDIFKDRIFVFTPRGDIIDLPKDSCVLDFAYAVHTYIGDHAGGVKVNGKNSALNTILKTNDKVEILINKNGHPSSKWLSFVKTPLAKKHINNYLKDNDLLSRFLSFGKN
jgi:GTP pyrophosphokinase